MSHILPELPLARFEVDRSALSRTDPDWLNQVWLTDTTRVLVIYKNQLPVTEELSLVMVKPSYLKLSIDDVKEFVALLGVTEQHTYVTFFADEDQMNEASWVSLRDVGAQLTALDVGLATTATALSTWHESNQYCAKCGSKTILSAAGWARTCPTENSEHYPRTEPAMIVAVEDEHGRILLGRRKQWPASWFSTLAGFVEAGESVEACVAREVLEESGVLIDQKTLRYLGSQPWPFPASLMLGYRATALTTAIKHDDDEMAEVKWFSRDEFIQACETKTLQLPNQTTIAWHLIKDWFGQQLPTNWSR